MSQSKTNGENPAMTAIEQELQKTKRQIDVNQWGWTEYDIIKAVKNWLQRKRQDKEILSKVWEVDELDFYVILTNLIEALYP